MKRISPDKIKQKAKEFVDAKKEWHFHILTPECQLNDEDDYALVLENTTDSESFVCYSDKPYMDIGKELVKLLHGDDILEDKEQKIEETEPSEQVKKILLRIKQLNKSGKAWHHHMLFPDCIFNKHQGKWTIIFEDKETGKVIESISDKEPKGDLQSIETLFYQQKKVS